MKLMVGLGNPGEKFKMTRHNTGFLFVEFVARILGDESFGLEKKFNAEIARVEDFCLVKPQTFMNNSGESVRKVLDFYKGRFEQRILVYDDLDIEFGKFKIDSSGPRVHNGVNSIRQNCLEEFLNIRIGTMGEEYFLIKKSNKSMAEEYILKEFSQKEEKELEVIWGRVWERLEQSLKIKVGN